MIKLRRILLCDYIYYILFFVVLVFSLVVTDYKEKSIYDGDEKKFYGYIHSINNDERTTIELRGKEKLLIYYENECDYELGDYILVTGELVKINNNTVFNLFDYKKYLYGKKIYWVVNAGKIKKVSGNNKIRYKVKEYIIKKINKSKNKEYLYAFILGDKSYIDESVLSSYQSNGIIHLFAVSGMHVGFLSLILLFFLKKAKVLELERYVVTSLFLFFYMFLTDFSPSVNRSCLLFFLLFINNIFYFHIKPQNILLLVAALFMFINPYNIYNIGFQFSYIISFALIININNIAKIKNYFLKLFFTSFISFVVSFPILVNNFFEVNFFSVGINIIFIPFISIVIFPLSIISFFIPIFNELLYLLINIFETISMWFSNFSFLVFSFGKLNFLLILLYYLILFLLFKYKSKLLIIIIIFLYLLFYNISYLLSDSYMSVLDVGQGDSILIHYPYNKLNILVDTGGSYYSKSSIVENKTIPHLKSMGIKYLDYLIITHGDYDHIGESLNLVNNFKINNIIINANNINDLEKKLISIDDINIIKLDDKEVYNLKNKIYLYSIDCNNENNSSIVAYLKIYNTTILLMGDIEKEYEQEFLNKYHIKNIDILKVPHHGSITSTTETFLDKLKPKYSVISVGKNNKFGHPSNIVVDRLNKYSKINITSIDGSVKYNFNKKSVTITTCPP